MALITSHLGGVRLAVRVQPRAAQTKLAGVHGGELKVCVTAPPVDAAANEALVRFLAQHLEVPRSVVRIIRGQTSRHKLIHVGGVTSEQVLKKLGLAASSGE